MHDIAALLREIERVDGMTMAALRDWAWRRLGLEPAGVEVAVTELVRLGKVARRANIDCVVPK